MAVLTYFWFLILLPGPIKLWKYFPIKQELMLLERIFNAEYHDHRKQNGLLTEPDLILTLLFNRDISWAIFLTLTKCFSLENIY